MHSHQHSALDPIRWVTERDRVHDRLGSAWAELSAAEQQAVVDGRRLAYLPDGPGNLCPGLANEDVTADWRSDIGNFPVFRRTMRQWMLRITAYVDRLLDDLDAFAWPESIKAMQRNWIGRSEGATMRFSTSAGPIEVFTTRPDTGLAQRFWWSRRSTHCSTRWCRPTGRTASRIVGAEGPAARVRRLPATGTPPHRRPTGSARRAG
jgi:hypothetical protein